MQKIKWQGWRSAGFSFCWMFLFTLCGNAVLRLHSLGQPVIGLIAVATTAAALFTLFLWLSSGAGDRSI